MGAPMCGCCAAALLRCFAAALLRCCAAALESDRRHAHRRQVCLIWDVEKFGPLFYVNLVINLIFVNDTIMQFFLPYRESILQGGSMVKNHKRIALHYIETWFFLDLASIIPFDYITMGIALDESNVSLLGATSLLRLMRLIKLVRILRASRIFSRWENSISMKYSQRDLMSLLFLVAFTLHLFSCLLGMAGQLMKARRNQEFLNIVESQIHQNTSCYGCIYNNPQFERYCFTGCFTPCELDIKLSIEMPDAIGLEADRYLDFLKSQESWICRRNQRGEIGDMPDAAFEVYVAGLYVALLQMGGGVGNIVPQVPTSTRPRPRRHATISLRPCAHPHVATPPHRYVHAPAHTRTCPHAHTPKRAHATESG